ncbi:uncharacterized protein METZ01_LOCUS26708, partial [marine metagenome]
VTELGKFVHDDALVRNLRTDAQTVVHGVQHPFSCRKRHVQRGGDLRHRQRSTLFGGVKKHAPLKPVHDRAPSDLTGLEPPPGRRSARGPYHTPKHDQPKLRLRESDRYHEGRKKHHCAPQYTAPQSSPRKTFPGNAAATDRMRVHRIR